MSKNPITLQLKNLAIPERLSSIVSSYICSLMMPTESHTQANAENLTGKSNSLFSNLLKKSIAFSKTTLLSIVKRTLTKLCKKRIKLFKKCPWTVAVIVDSTLHARSSLRIENCQKLNHGDGWVVGHQWTNIGIQIAEQFLPLPPIPFYTKEYCKENGLEYKTEHEKVASFIKSFSLKEIGLNIPPEEVVVIMDSGFDSKEIEKVIISKKWDFIIATKCKRNFSANLEEWCRVDRYSEHQKIPSKTIRVKSYRGKKRKIRQYRATEQVGFLKGVHRKIKLVSSKKSKGKTKYLACSNINVDLETILFCYQLRWDIEIFHRDIKSYLGLEDARVRSFNSLRNHVNWVYIAYLLLKERSPDLGIKNAQLLFEKEVANKALKEAVQRLTQINGGTHLKEHYQSVLATGKCSMAA